MAHKLVRWLHNPCRLGDPQRFRSQAARSEVAHKWARWLHNPCRLGGPHRFKLREAGTEVAHKWARWLHNCCRLGGPHCFRSRGRDHRLPTSGQGGYMTPAASGLPTASQWATKSEVAHKWARWLHNPCRLGAPNRFTVGDKVRSDPQVGKVAR